MVMRDQSAMDNALQFLEEEQRQYKAQVFKFQQQLEQVQGSMWSLGDRLNSLEGAVSTVMAHGSRVSRLEEDLRQTRESIERFQSDVEGQRQQDTTTERLLQTELERERQARTELYQKLGDIERTESSFRDRLQLLDDTTRKRQEDLFNLERSLEPLRHRDEQLGQQLSSGQDALKRLAQEVEELRQESRALQAQDEVYQSRLQHLMDQIHRLETQDELRELEQRLSSILAEQNELHRIERQRTERSTVDLQLSYEQYRTVLDEVQQQILQLHGKAQSLTQYIEQVREQFWEIRNSLTEQFGRIAANEELHRRRQVSELEQQLKELRVWQIDPPRS